MLLQVNTSFSFRSFVVFSSYLNARCLLVMSPSPSPAPQAKTSDPSAAAAAAALSQATAHRLSKFSLKNYAAPTSMSPVTVYSNGAKPNSTSPTGSSGSSSSSGSTPTGQPQTPAIMVQRPSPPATGTPKVAGPHPVHAQDMPAAPAFDAASARPVVLPKGGLVLTSSSSPPSMPPPPPPQLSLDTNTNTYPFPRMLTSPMSPSPTAEEVPALIHRTGSESTVDSDELSDLEPDTHHQPKRYTSSPVSLPAAFLQSQTSGSGENVGENPKQKDLVMASGDNTEEDGENVDSDSLYKAFLNQWCFATGSQQQQQQAFPHRHYQGIEGIGA